MVFKCQSKVIEGGNDRDKTSLGVLEGTDNQLYQMSDIRVAVFKRCDTLEKESTKQNDIIRELSERVANHEVTQTEANRLKDELARYEKTVTRLQMKEKELTTDIHLKAKAVQRLGQRKRNRLVQNIHIHEECTTSSQYLARYCNMNSMKQFLRHRRASLPVVKTLVKTLPVMIVRHARRLSKAMAEYSMAELNYSTNNLNNTGYLI